MALVRWEVRWAKVIFEDVPSQDKIRPVLVANDKTIYVLALKMTSSPERDADPFDYPLKHWAYANLSKQTTVRIAKLLRLDPSDILDHIGMLHPTDMLEIQKRMLAYQNSRHK